VGDEPRLHHLFAVMLFTGPVRLCGWLAGDLLVHRRCYDRERDRAPLRLAAAEDHEFRGEVHLVDHEPGLYRSETRFSATPPADTR
jgi:hypothetical protein